jgi:hypothetical protein
LTVAGVAFGYAGQVPVTIVVSAPTGDQPCGAPLKVSVLLQDHDNELVTEAPVVFSFVSGHGPGDIINPPSTMSDEAGIAITYVTLHCSPPHSVVLKATSGDVSGTVVIQTNGKSLPRTDTDPSNPSLGTLLAALAVIGGSGAILRRLSTGPR